MVLGGQAASAQGRISFGTISHAPFCICSGADLWYLAIFRKNQTMPKCQISISYSVPMSGMNFQNEKWTHHNMWDWAY